MPIILIPMAALPAASGFVDGLEEFQPVAVWVLAVEAAHAGEVFVEENRGARRAQPAGPVVQIADHQARMRFAGWAEVLLHAEVQLDAVTAEPAATAGSERRRFGHLVKAQHPAVELTQYLLAARRAGQLHMMD